MKWACDPFLSSSSDVHPFRLRAGIWSLLPEPERLALLSAVEAQIERQIGQIERHVPGLDPVETTGIDLALDLQRDRLRQIERWRTAGCPVA